MKHFIRALALVIGAYIGLPLAPVMQPAIAQTIVQIAAVPTPGGIVSSKWRDGNDGTVSCSTVTCANIGVADGFIEENSSSSFEILANSGNDNLDFIFGYDEFTNSDVQVCARIPDQLEWTGPLATFTGFGIKITEGIAPIIHSAQLWINNSGDVPRFKFGVPPDENVIQGDPGTAAPVYACLAFVNATNTWSAWQSPDGVTYTQVGADQTYNPSGTLQAGIFGTSAVAGTTVEATLTSVSISNTVTVTGGSPPVESACEEPYASPTNAVDGTGFSRMANIPCRNGNDIVLGLDMSLSPEQEPAARSGIFNNNSSVPTYFQGKHLYQCNLDWKDIELTNQNFDWSWFEDNCLSKVGPGANQYDGLLVQVRGVVAEIEDCDGSVPNGTPEHQSEWTAPAWVITIAEGIAGGIDSEGCRNDFNIHNIELNNSLLRAHYIDFIDEFGTEYADTPNMFVVMHFMSTSRGEECCAGGTVAALTDVVNGWLDAFPVEHRWKLAWLDEDETAFPLAHEGGTGNRGGIIENWMRWQYTPGDAEETGQILDGSGYLTINWNFEPISELRHWMDEWEFLNQTPNMYLGAALRAMQMRRNVGWTASGSQINPRMDNWVSLQMGHLRETQTDAWVWLMRTYTKFSASPTEVKNLERGLMQRETQGATTPTNQLAHGKNISGNDTLPQANWVASWTRRGNSIGIAVEDAFWPTSLTQDAMLKITYVNNVAATLTVRKGAAVLGTIAVTNTGAQDIRTASFCLTSFNPSATGTVKDFQLDAPSGNIDVMFVRLIKSGNGFPVICE